MYVNELGDTVLDTYAEEMPELKIRDKAGNPAKTTALDLLATLDSRGNVVIAAVNKDPARELGFRLVWQGERPRRYSIHTLAGKSPDSYNGVDKNEAAPEETVSKEYNAEEDIFLPPHSVNVLRFS
jgi:alpha-N-arabinofuranosidase